MKRISIISSTVFIILGLMACNFSTAQKNEVALEEESSERETAKDAQQGLDKVGGVFLHYQVAEVKDGELQPKGAIKIFFGNDQLRAETDLNIFFNAKVVLTDTDDSGMGFLLSPETKTYFERNLKSWAYNNYMRLYESSFKMSQEEKLEDFDKLATLYTSQFHYLKFRPENEDDDLPLREKDGVISVKYWLTDEIPNTAGISQVLRDKPQLLDGLYSKVYQNDLIPVKIEESKSGDVIRVIELIDHQEIIMLGDQFEIPEGYSLKD